MVPLKYKVPRVICCTPHYFIGNEPNVEKLSYKAMRQRPVFMVPSGTKNLAANRPVTSNELLPVVGELEMVTDGDNSGEDGHYVDIGFDRKWIQIDLEQLARLYAIVVWHDGHNYAVYRDVVLQVSNDPEFCSGVRTLFNNDHDNSSGLGQGRYKGYVETRYGKIIDAGGVQARYLRLYSKGSSRNDQNKYVEVAVYGLGQVKPQR